MAAEFGEVDLACYEKKGGMLRKTAEMELETYDAPLGDILKKAVPLVHFIHVCSVAPMCVRRLVYN